MIQIIKQKGEYLTNMTNLLYCCHLLLHTVLLLLLLRYSQLMASGHCGPLGVSARWRVERVSSLDTVSVPTLSFPTVACHVWDLTVRIKSVLQAPVTVSLSPALLTCHFKRTLHFAHLAISSSTCDLAGLPEHYLNSPCEKLISWRFHSNVKFRKISQVT